MTKMLDLLEDFCVLRSYGYCRLDGSMNIHDRRDSVGIHCMLWLCQVFCEAIVLILESSMESSAGVLHLLEFWCSAQ